MKFNNKLAVLVVCLTFAYAVLCSLFQWENQIVMLALGVFLAKFGDTIQFYFRTKPPDETKTTTTTTTTPSETKE